MKTLTNLKPTKNFLNIASIDIETITYHGNQIVSSIIFVVNGVTYIEHIKDILYTNTNKDMDEIQKIMWSNIYKKVWKKFKFNTVIYAHNLGSFDGYFIMKGLIRYLDNSDYIKCLIDSSNQYISISVVEAVKDDIKLTDIIFKDSLRIFPRSLDKLGETFQLGGKTQRYDIKWSSYDYHRNVNVQSQRWLDYVKYASNDAQLLYNIMKKAQEFYKKHYQIDLAKAYSTASLALRLYRTQFMILEPSITNKKVRQIYVPNDSLDNAIRQSYYGGAVAAYKRYGKNLHYYDVNSLYPWAMLQDLPGNYIKKVYNLKKLKDFFGFVEVIVRYNGREAPLLPYRDDVNGLQFPVGKWKGLYFSEELKMAIKYGYNVSLTGVAYEFEKIRPFTQYVNHFYNLKSKSIDHEKYLHKLMLNTLYGYFGRDKNVFSRFLLNNDKLNYLLAQNIVSEYFELTDELNLVKLNRKIDIKISKILRDINIVNTFESTVLSNVAIASAITSIARTKMMEFKRIPNNPPYYTDTDSIFLGSPLPSKYISNEIGMMKDELNGSVINEAIFLGLKQYVYTLEDVRHSVFAGIPRDYLTLQDFKDLCLGKTIDLTVPDRFIKRLNHLKIKIIKNPKVRISITNSYNLQNNNYKPIKISKVNLLNILDKSIAIFKTN